MNVLIASACGQLNEPDGANMSISIICAILKPMIRRIVPCVWLIGMTALPAYAQWYFEIGPVYRADMEISVQGGSRAGDSGLLAAQAGTAGSLPAAQSSLLQDDGTAQVMRQFDDGYVGPSGFAWALNEGWTQYFGYENAEQHDPDAHALTYRLSLQDSGLQRRTVTHVRADDSGWADRKCVSGMGIMATAGYLFRQEESWSWAMQAQIGWFNGIQADFRNRSAYRQHIERNRYEAELVQSQTYAYTYDTLQNPAFPEAPYAMEDPMAVGPMIADTPESITLDSESTLLSDRLINRTGETAVSHVDLKLDVRMLTLQLGPRLLWQPLPRLAFFAQPAISVNMIDAEARRRETFSQSHGASIASWSDRANDQSWRAGLSGKAGQQFMFSEHWRLSAACGYHWIDVRRFQAGPDQIRMDLSGYQAELALIRTF